MALQPGDRIDRFTLEELLGEGGQGSVWRATDPMQPDKPCALKLVPTAMARGSALERARREAHALSRLEHPSLVACDGLFEDLKRGVLGLVMGFVKGTSLSQAQLDPRFSDAHAGATLKHVAEALAYLHGRGVVHRDLKLDNVLIADAFFDAPDDARNVVLVDLGIAIATDPGTRLTQEGGLVGTLSYLAPEALDPANFEGGTASPSVDIFAFGVLATRVLAGAHPTGLPQSSTPYLFAEAYRKAKAGAPLRAPGVEGAWGTLIQDALRVDPSQRISDGTELSLRVREAGPAARAPAAQRQAAAVHNDEVESGASSIGAATAAAAKPTDRTSAAAVAAASQASTNARSPAANRGKVFFGALLLLGAAGAGLYFANATRNKTPPLTPKHSLTSPASVSPAPTRAKPAPSSAEPDATAAFLPQGCHALCACCPSGRDCGPSGCSGELSESTSVVLRLGSVMSAHGDPLAEGAQLCMRLDEDGGQRVCFPTKRGKNEAEGGGLQVTIADVIAGRISLQVEQRLELDSAADVWSPMAEGVLEFTAPLQGAAYCRGVQIPSLNGHVPVGRIRLFLDPAEAPAPERCP